MQNGIKIRWFAVACMMLVTFLFGTDLFSSENTGPIVRWVLSWFLPQGADIKLLGSGEGMMRKTAHFLEYALLAFLWWWALRGSTSGWQWRWVFIAWLAATLWASVDELQQAFISTKRTGSPWDVLIDSSGALTAQVLTGIVWFINHRRIAGGGTRDGEST